MAKKTDTLVIKLETDGEGKTKASIAGVSNEVEKFGKQSDKAAGGVLSFKNAIGAIAFGAITKGFIDINVEYQKLSASLKTVTGSQDAANIAFSQLEGFASTTPYQLEQVVGSFIKLKSLGLDPSIEALTSYGNTAAAMGKDLNQLIEAVADAATGEFERLKEFGITSRQQGEQVSFTFRGVTTTIKKEADAIEGYLRDIGDTTFASGMAEQTATLGGAFSNLEDSVSGFARAIGDAGVNDALEGMVRLLTESLSGWTKLIKLADPTKTLQQELNKIHQRVTDLKAYRDADSFIDRMQATLRLGVVNAAELDNEIATLNKRALELYKELAPLVTPVNEQGAALKAAATEANNYYQALDLVAGEFEAMETEALKIELGLKLPAGVIEELRQLDELAERIAATNTTYTERARELHDELERGALTYDEYAKEMDRLDNGDFGKHADSGEEAMQRLEAAARGWGEEFTNTMAEMVQSGKLSFSDLADSIISDLLRIMIYQNITAPILGGLGLVPAPTAHTGGIVGSTGGSTFVNPMAFAGAQRYHTGGMVGLGPNEVPIIANKGEEVLTENDPRHRNNMSGGDIKVEVIKNGSPVEVDSANARTDINGTVISIIMNDYNRGGQMRRLIDGGQK